MKLPVILTAMVAALAIPSSIASEATEEKTEAAAPEAEAEAKAETKPMHKKHKRHHHRRGSSHHGHPANAYDLPYDDPNFPRGTSGSGCGAEPVSQGKILPPEVPGQKGPMVPAGQ